MTARPWMPFYPADYLADTRHLTTEQHGAYLLLLMTMWQAGGELADDDKKLARIAGVSPRRWHLVAPDVMALFYAEAGKIRHKRLDREHQKCVSITQKRSASGKRGGKSKALKNNEPGLANAKQMPTHITTTTTNTVANATVYTDREPVTKAHVVEAQQLLDAPNLTAFDYDFLQSLSGWRSLTVRQAETLNGIRAKVAAGPRDPPIYRDPTMAACDRLIDKLERQRELPDPEIIDFASHRGT